VIKLGLVIESARGGGAPVQTHPAPEAVDSASRLRRRYADPPAAARLTERGACTFKKRSTDNTQPKNRLRCFAASSS
jgi:hypothetical protein